MSQSHEIGTFISTTRVLWSSCTAVSMIIHYSQMLGPFSDVCVLVFLSLVCMSFSTHVYVSVESTWADEWTNLRIRIRIRTQICCHYMCTSTEKRKVAWHLIQKCNVQIYILRELSHLNQPE